MSVSLSLSVHVCVFYAFSSLSFYYTCWIMYQHQSPDTDIECFDPHRDPLCYSLTIIATSFLLLTLLLVAPYNHSPVFHLCNFAITKMLYKRNRTLNNLLRLPLFTQLQSHGIHPGVECIYYLFSLLSSIPCCGWTTVCSTIHSWKGTCTVSSLWLIRIKLLETFLKLKSYLPK